MIPDTPLGTLEELLRAHPRAIVHLRAQLQRKRLGLIFGSGASKDLGFPDWSSLIRRIATHKDVRATALLEKFQRKPTGKKPAPQRSLTSITQILYGHFRDRFIRLRKLVCPLTFLEEQKIRNEWLTIIHHELYKDVDHANRKRTIDEHQYIPAFVKLIKDSPMTVNYNFDDTLEKLLMFNRTDEEAFITRGYETTYRPNSQFQNNNGVIYHPNGYLPSRFFDGSSPELIFSDESFQDQLISAATGGYVQLSNFIFRNTCILIGLSLEDATLQHLMRQNAVTNPGHIHYIVHHVGANASLDRAARGAIFEANFSCYNLYTIFLTSGGIRLLAELISMPEVNFALQFSEQRRKFVYYLTGSIGVGKSTAVSNFRNLYTYDEWIDERRDDMAVSEKRLPTPVITSINAYVAEQFRKKNFGLGQRPEGLHLMDRCPLDPLTFGTPPERKGKAQQLLNVITDHGHSKIEKGHLILLDADVRDISERGSYKHKYWTESELDELAVSINQVYENIPKSVICTRGRTAHQVSKEIAKIIFLNDYQEVNIQQYLAKFAGRRGAQRC